MGRVSGFSLVEILVSVAVLSLIMMILMAVSVQIGGIWQKTTGKIEQFRGARAAFESMTRRLSQATLNTYWDYDNPTTPTKYIRQSELRFICGRAATLIGNSTNLQPTHAVFFQAPFGFVDESLANADKAVGLGNLLNTWGYFIEFGNDDAERPSILGSLVGSSRYRYRLHEFTQPANAFTMYQYTGTTRDYDSNKPNGMDWFRQSMNLPLLPAAAPNRPSHVLADNIIALILLPKLSTQDDPSGNRLSPDYLYDSTVGKDDPSINSKNQLPPIIQVTLVAIDETSAKRMEKGSAMPDFGLDSLFASAANYAQDLDTLQKNLTDRHVAFRVFTTNVTISGAKWSTDQVQ
ncbi:MAG: Verru_Chthon cassette protein C [Verrucomicrobiales bacterium]|jgi:uncharacterized protein (TIGR02599 family)|nr:Verru_Chthon cassette protein C [Verrucomicrobiales bacterium]